MSDNPINVLIVLKLPPKVQNQYLDGVRNAFPDLRVDLVDTPDLAGPYLADADVLIAFGAQVSAKAAGLYEAATSLKWVQALGTGVDGITDVPTLRDDVIVTNMHGIHGAPVSEAAISMMLAMARHLPHYVRNQESGSWNRVAPHLLEGKIAGILGVGAIAEALAPRLKALGMRVVGISGTPREVPGFDAVVAREDMLGAVGEFDHFVVLAPLTDETRNSVGAEIFAAMKPSAFLINVARGGVTDEDALLTALRAGEIAGAALDVFVDEPLPPDHPFWSMDNVLVTPHIAGFNTSYPDHALPIIIENMRRFLAGERVELINLVQRD